MRLLTIATLLLFAGCQTASLTIDPSSIEQGTRLGEWTVRETRVNPDRSSPGDWTGEVLFTGESVVRGTFQSHPDAEATMLCFFVDAADAPKLPRFRNDVRKPWFCFTNEDDVRKVAKAGMPATIRIADFHYAFAPSDVVNMARFVRIE